MQKLPQKLSLVLIICLLSSLSLFAQQNTQEQELPYPQQVMWEARKTSNSKRYLAINLELKDKEELYKKSKKLGNYFQVLAVSNSQIGQYHEALSEFDKFLPPSDAFDPQKLDAYKPHNAINFIESIAASKQVILINEGHHVPLHRAFTLRLLKKLYKKGFRYFCAEAIFDNELNHRGYCLFGKSGFYTDEPVYADLIRIALKLGYKVVPYEYEYKGDNDETDREYGEARNLYERIFLKDPKAKVLVHVGYGHLSKSRSDGEKMMAQHFKEISKINPFSIDQYDMTEKGDPEKESRIYKHSLKKNLSSDSVIFLKKGKSFSTYEGTDAQVFHPHSEYKNGRPTWLLLDGVRQYYKFPAEICKNTFPCLVQAFYENEGETGVPVDQIKVTSNDNLPALILPKGSFLLRVVDSSGNVVNQTNIQLP